MNKYDIKENPRTGGVYCFFTHNGQEYYADLCELDGLDHWYTECMIFASGNKQVTNWLDLYCKRGIRVTPENLADCIDEFIKSLPADA